MKVYIEVFIIGKNEKTWKDESGIERISYSVNIAQQDGAVIDTLRLKKEIYEKIEKGKNYTIAADYGIGKNGAFLRVTDATPQAKS